MTTTANPPTSHFDHRLPLTVRKRLANLTRPLTSDEARRLDEALARFEHPTPVHDMVLAALGPDAVVDEAAYDRLLRVTDSQ